MYKRQLETLLEDAAALTGTAQFDFSRRAVAVLCADNGVVAQGISQTDQSVTRAVAENLAARLRQLPRAGRQLVPHRRAHRAGKPAAFKNLTGGACMSRAKCIMAVSYTHLDVYKRQG